MLLLCSLSFVVQAQEKAKPQVKNIARSDKYISLTIDRTDQLWVGTNKEGLWHSVIDETTGEVKGLSLRPTTDLGRYNLQSITTSGAGNDLRIWVGHNGIANGGSASGGGVTMLLPGDPKGTYFTSELSATVAKGMKLQPRKNDGLPTRNCKAITTDKNGTIWTAHGYHDITILGNITIQYNQIYPPQVTNENGYYVTPGAVGRLNGSVFDNVSSEMPYPAYTIKTPPDKSAGTRPCYSVSAGEHEVWVGSSTYEIDGGGIAPSCINRFDLSGKFKDRYNYTNTPGLPFTSDFSSPIPSTVHFSKSGDGWVGFNRNLGFACYKLIIGSVGEWKYVPKLLFYNKETKTNETSKLLPNGIRLNINCPNLIHSQGKNVFIGTMDGLLVYKGEGALDQDSSYTLVTTADGLYSNNIKAIATNSKYAYVVSDAGLNQVYIPGDVEVLHVRDRSNPYVNKEGKNYGAIGTLTHQRDLKSNADNTVWPMLAADGTESTIFRYYTSDFDGFYNSNKYTYAVNTDFLGADVQVSGKLRLRPLDQYEDNSKSYVDFFYTHPTYIDPEKVEQDYNFLTTFKIEDKAFNTLFQHGVKIVLPPVYLGHGVWSDIHSLESIEQKLLANGYKHFQIIKSWRLNGKVAEHPWEEDKNVVPEYLKKLLLSAEANGFSAGKASVVVHSRGGLYTRAYIEEMGGVKYEDNIHSFITLNTPHSGSQLANLVMDMRYFPTIDKTIGELFNVFVAEGDWPLKHGARVLRVDGSFIQELNSEANLTKLKTYRIPIHAVATSARLCDIPRLKACYRQKRTDKNAFLSILLSIVSSNIISNSEKTIDGFLHYVFNDEDSDLIVPLSSAAAGLKAPYVSYFEGEPIAHIVDLTVSGIHGVTAAPSVLDKIVALLKENVDDPKSNFTRNGLNPVRGENRLRYKFLPNLSDDLAPEHPAPDHMPYTPKSSKRLEESAPDFQIEYNEPQVMEGDSLKFAVRSSGYDSVFVIMENNAIDPDSLYFQWSGAKEGLTPFAFKIPRNYFGHTRVVAYGLKKDGLKAIDTLRLDVALTPSLTLLSLQFEGNSEVELLQHYTHPFHLIGLFSDSLRREINTLANVNYYIEDTTLIKRLDHFSIYAKTNAIGQSAFVGMYGNLSAKLQIRVLPNSSLKKTVLSKFVGQKTKTEVKVVWATEQQYKTKRFLLEKSTTGTKFDSLFTVAGQGTSYTWHQYGFTDGVSSANVYYRLKIIDSLGAFVYSDTILVSDNITSLSDDASTTIANAQVTVSPNPVGQDGFVVRFESLVDDPNAEISLYEFAGKQVMSQKWIVRRGSNHSAPIVLPQLAAGIYFVKVKTLGGVQSTKMILGH